MNMTRYSIGQKIGNWEVIDLIKENNVHLYLCKCVCGNVRKKRPYTVGKTRSCGCIPQREARGRPTGRTPSNYKDLTGTKFNRLTVLNRSHTEKTKAGANSVWKCQCDCGGIVLVSGSNIRNTKSCGCYFKDAQRKMDPKTKPPGHATANCIYGNYRSRAKKKGLEFSLTLEEFMTLISLPCVYCGKLKSQICRYGHARSELHYNGVDRKNPLEGYTISNSVPCCKTCNYGKSILSYDEWIEHLDNLVEFRLNKKDET